MYIPFETNGVINVISSVHHQDGPMYNKTEYHNNRLVCLGWLYTFNLLTTYLVYLTRKYLTLWRGRHRIEQRLSSLTGCRRSSMPMKFCCWLGEESWSVERTCNFWHLRTVTTHNCGTSSMRPRSSNRISRTDDQNHLERDVIVPRKFKPIPDSLPE